MDAWELSFEQHKHAVAGAAVHREANLTGRGEG